MRSYSLRVGSNLQPLHYAAIGGIAEKVFDTIYNVCGRDVVNPDSILFRFSESCISLMDSTKTLQSL